MTRSRANLFYTTGMAPTRSKADEPIYIHGDVSTEDAEMTQDGDLNTEEAEDEDADEADEADEADDQDDQNEDGGGAPHGGRARPGRVRPVTRPGGRSYRAHLKILTSRPGPWHVPETGRRGGVPPALRACPLIRPEPPGDSAPARRVRAPGAGGPGPRPRPVRERHGWQSVPEPAERAVGLREPGARISVRLRTAVCT